MNNSRANRRRLRYWLDTATDEQEAIGRAWYPTTAGHIMTVANLAGLKWPQRACMAAAVLSPHARWDLVLLHLGAWLTDPTAPMPAFTRNRVKARRCLDEGWAALPAIKSPKVRAFAQALCGDTEAVVLDVWMIRALIGLRTDRDSLTLRQYEALVEDVKAVAQARGLTPRDCQAIAWVSIRWPRTDSGWLDLDPVFGARNNED
jgi:hypothetical protein